MTTTRLSRRSLLATAAGTVVAAVGLPAGRATAATAGAPPREPAPVPPLKPGALQSAIDDLEHPVVTAAQLRIGGSAGSWYGSSGAIELPGGRPVRTGDKVRIGSVTKVFVATVALQLVAERRLTLDTTVQRVLPGLLPSRWPGITLRQLLNHTSGLPAEHGPDLPDLSTPERVHDHRFDRWTPRRLVATVTHGAPDLKFTPGTAQEYRGVNYVLAALMVEELTGRPYGAEISARLLRPLGLRGTSVPGHERRVRGPHVHGYLRMTDGSLRDMAVVDPSDAWGEGEMVSTTADLDRFGRVLFSGALLPPRLQRELFTLPPEEVRMWGDPSAPARYSVGLQTATVNGVTLWGKTGEMYGYASGLFSTVDQARQLVYSFTPVRRDASLQEMTRRIAHAATAP
ncbi:beta-lactamase family protein [Streptomyces sp. LX-29]|uniref:serine hydrolase domain-containing protein n=1 Tax=Streptomyces sp. LX-29 TaxID=2900152 RepID=UPI00240E93C4|nr:serine hydrolase domain-containing protein [Streptomyces sp. LX-29]WFB07249.1 beta-lactamase family protein [Streptomyces sp. LX-29]